MNKEERMEKAKKEYIRLPAQGIKGIRRESKGASTRYPIEHIIVQDSKVIQTYLEYQDGTKAIVGQKNPSPLPCQKRLTRRW